MELIERYIESHYYRYEHINKYSPKKLNKYIQKTQDKFVAESREWTIKKNSIWLLRLYASIKMMLSSTVLYSHYEFSENKQLYLSMPYYEYYGLLNCCRALTLSRPEKDEFETVFKAPHSTIINLTVETLKSIDNNLANEFEKHINLLKDRREMFSYNFPTKKIEEEMTTFYDTLEYSKLICEIAQLNSLILEESKKNNSDSFVLDSQYIKEDVQKYFDSLEDFNRLRYIARKMYMPHNLFVMCTEGLVEDFLGNFMDEYTEENNLGCLHNLQLIFPFP